MTYESECQGKVRFLTRKEAKRTIRRMRGRDHNARLDAYKCSRCEIFWHIGHHHPNARMHARERRQGAQ